MNRLELRVSLIDELIVCFESEQKGKRAHFTRTMNRLEESEREEVWKALEARGHQRYELPEPNYSEASPGVKVTWTEEEWDTVSSLVWNKRREQPELSLVELCKEVMSSLPEERRRKHFTTTALEPLLTRLRARDNALLNRANEASGLSLVVEKKDMLLKDKEDLLKEKDAKLIEFARTMENQSRKISSLQAQLDVLPRKIQEETLGTLTDQEVLGHFKAKVLSLLSPEERTEGLDTEELLGGVGLPELLGHAVKEGLGLFLESRNSPSQPFQPVKLTPLVNGQVPRATPVRVANPPRVTIVGPKEGVQREIEKRLEGRAKFNFVLPVRSSNSYAFPPNQDIVVFMTRFIDHAIEEQGRVKLSGTPAKILRCKGCLSSLVRELDPLLPRE